MSRRTTFKQVAPSHQFEQLLAAASVEYPHEVEALRALTPADQRILLQNLAVTHQPVAEVVELWRVQKGLRELVCSAHMTEAGIDVRLVEGPNFRRTQLCADWAAAGDLSQEWREALVDTGWTSDADSSGSPNHA